MILSTNSSGSFFFHTSDPQEHPPDLQSSQTKWPFGQGYRFFRAPKRPGTSLHEKHFKSRMSWRATSLFPLKSDIVSRPKDKLERLKWNIFNGNP